MRIVVIGLSLWWFLFSSVSQAISPCFHEIIDAVSGRSYSSVNRAWLKSKVQLFNSSVSNDVQRGFVFGKMVNSNNPRLIREFSEKFSGILGGSQAISPRDGVIAQRAGEALQKRILTLLATRRLFTSQQADLLDALETFSKIQFTLARATVQKSGPTNQLDVGLDFDIQTAFPKLVASREPIQFTNLLAVVERDLKQLGHDRAKLVNLSTQFLELYKQAVRQGADLGMANYLRLAIDQVVVPALIRYFPELSIQVDGGVSPGGTEPIWGQLKQEIRATEIDEADAVWIASDLRGRKGADPAFTVKLKKYSQWLASDHPILNLWARRFFAVVSF